MHGLTPRHRRKAGSGPPADALIAWIGTDTYLREAAATASYRRWTALPMPSNTRSAGAAVVTCFALACAAVLGITAIISHGRATAQHKIATPSAFGQDALTHSPKPSPPPPTDGSGVSPAPAGIAPMLAEQGGSQPITVPPATSASLDATPAPVPAISSLAIADPNDSGKPETAALDKPTDSSKSGDTDTSGDPHTPLAGRKPGHPETSATRGTPQSGTSSVPTPTGRIDGSAERSARGLGSSSDHRPDSGGGSASAGSSTRDRSSTSRLGSASVPKSSSNPASRSSRG